MLSVSAILSICSLLSFGTGSVIFLGRNIYRATVYLEKIENTLEELCQSIKQLERRDSHHENRISDVELFLSKSTDFEPKRYF